MAYAENTSEHLAVEYDSGAPSGTLGLLPGSGESK